MLVKIPKTFSELLIVRGASGIALPIPMKPVLATRILSTPPVSNEILSFSGNLIAVFVSPV